jgi:hypothetical protein
MTSTIAGGVDCDLHPAVPHLTSLLPYLTITGAIRSPQGNGRPGVAILSAKFADDAQLCDLFGRHHLVPRTLCRFIVSGSACLEVSQDLAEVGCRS